MNEIIESKIRENIALENQCFKKLDFIRNELIPYYGSDISLKEIEDLLVESVFKIYKTT